MGVLYGAGVRLRRALFESGLLRVSEIPQPVISVGNLTTGGTGKTPLVESIAIIAANADKRVCILTRGYGREKPNERVIVSNGKALLAGVAAAGDEPYLLAERLFGLSAVISDADRLAAAKWAAANLASEVFILDDGFQHLAMARDLNILVIDATNPFGGGSLLPRGRLREPLSGMKRADCVVITHADQVEEIDSLIEQVKPFVDSAPILSSRVRTSQLRLIHSPERVDNPLTQPVGAFCGTGNPKSFFTHLQSEGQHLSFMRAFPDHHKYLQSDIDKTISYASSVGAQALLTTAKDAVKLQALRFDMPCYVVEIELEFNDERQFREIVRSAINRKPIASPNP